MAKQKSRSLVSADAKKKIKPVAPVVNLLDEDDWVIVRKQKITILIPPLPGDVQLIASNTGESQPEMPSTAIDADIPILEATSPNNSAPESEAKSLSAAPECSIPATKIDHSTPFLSLPKTSENVHQLISLRGRTSNHGLSSTLKLRKHALIFGDGMPLLNQSLRAINIEKKIRKAGGLISWLISLGLERFVKIFQQKKMNKFQLANLNMKKLKDMGAFAVGPRRKLIHALDCLCQPYCFEHVRLSAV